MGTDGYEPPSLAGKRVHPSMLRPLFLRSPLEEKSGA